MEDNIRSSLQFLSSVNLSEQEYGLRVLINLTATPGQKLQIFIFRAVGVELFTNLLQSTNEVIQMLTAWFLFHLTIAVDNSGIVLQSELFQYVIPLLQSDNEDVVEKALWLTTHLSLNVTHSQALGNFGAIEVLTQLLGSSSTVTTAAASQPLRNLLHKDLCQDFEENQKAFCLAGGVQIVKSVLSGYPPPAEEILLWSTSILHVLSIHTPLIRRIIAAAGIIIPLVSLLSASSTSEQIQEQILKVLVNLSLTPETENAFIAAQALLPLVDLLLFPKIGAGLQQLALSTLANLSCNPEIRGTLRYTGLAAGLVDLIGGSGQNHGPDIEEAACNVVGNISIDEVLRLELRESGAMQIIVRLVASPSVPVRNAAQGAFENLSLPIDPSVMGLQDLIDSIFDENPSDDIYTTDEDIDMVMIPLPNEHQPSTLPSHTNDLSNRTSTSYALGSQQPPLSPHPHPHAKPATPSPFAKPAALPYYSEKAVPALEPTLNSSLSSSSFIRFSSSGLDPVRLSTSSVAESVGQSPASVVEPVVQSSTPAAAESSHPKSPSKPPPDRSSKSIPAAKPTPSSIPPSTFKSSVLKSHSSAPAQLTSRHPSRPLSTSTPSNPPLSLRPPSTPPTPTTPTTPPSPSIPKPVSDARLRNATLSKPAFLRRDRIVKEILESELSYVNSLGICIRVYLNPLVVNPPIPPILQAETVGSVFLNIQRIFKINCEFLKKLRSRMSRENAALGDLFLWLCNETKMLPEYTYFINNYNNSQALVEDLCAKAPRFKEYLDKCQFTQTSRNLDLLSFMIQPVQRVPRYILLLQDLAKHTPEDHPDYENLQKGLERTRQAAATLNEAQRASDSQAKIQKLNGALIGQPEGFSLTRSIVEPPRCLIREGSVLQVSKKGGSKYCYLFLFDDMLLFTRQQKTKFHYQKVALLLELKVVDIPQNETGQHSFYLLWSNKQDTRENEVTITCSKAEEKGYWLSCLREAMSTLKKNRITRSFA